MNGNGRPEVELRWDGKEQPAILPPVSLVEDPTRSYGALESQNLLIHGDNLPALAALHPRYANQVRCIYIDPPYNTGSGFEHYPDGLEHGRWLSMMRDRLAAMHSLLSPDGVLFVSIDDAECAYLTVLLDELFGRQNRCGPFIWERKKKPSFLDGSLAVVTEYVLAYAKDRAQSPPFVGGLTTAGKKYPLNNAGNPVRTLTFPAESVLFRCPDQIFQPQDMSEGRIVTRLLDRFRVRDGRNIQPFRLEGEWRYSQATLDAAVRSGATIVISKAPFRPNHVRTGGEPKKLKNLLSIAHYGMSTYEDATSESRALFGDANAFAYPKPEKLIATIIGAVTQPGDIVLDAFAGSGTTGAVAHKMRRRWIMIECGEHCATHILPRMRKVIDGTDPGGITKAVDWTGGGGFRYFQLRRMPSSLSSFGRGTG